MAQRLEQVDPAWAWAQYEPDAQRPWDHARAAHLYRRAGFGASWAQIQQSVELGPAATLHRLFQAGEAQDTPRFEAEVADLASAMAATGTAGSLSAWWLYAMVHTPDPLTEKMTLFWHGHFATSAAKVTNPKLMLDQNLLLRSHALGRFEPLILGISRDPAMLIWLDSTSNRKIHPNENYARELMELFCLGPGHYTEQDIKQIARAFTGWEVHRDRFVFNPHQHDRGEKSFLGRSGPFGGEEAIRIVLEQPAAPRFIVRKLVNYFLFDEPDAPDTLIEPLAAQLRDNGFHLGPVVRRILASNLMFSQHAMASKVRSPVELAVGLLRALEARTDMGALAVALDRLGQALFFPPNVKGWDGGRAWISSASILARANLVRDLSLGGKLIYPHGGLPAQCERDGATDPPAMVDRLLRLLVAPAVPGPARQSLIELASSGDHPDQRLARVVSAIAALPEFHLS